MTGAMNSRLELIGAPLASIVVLNAHLSLSGHNFESLRQPKVRSLAILFLIQSAEVFTRSQPAKSKHPWSMIDFSAVADPLAYLDYRPPAVCLLLYIGSHG